MAPPQCSTQSLERCWTILTFNSYRCSSIIKPQRSNQALESRLHDIERKVVSASTYAKEAGEAAGSSLLSWITSIVLLVTCGAVLYFQYKAHLHRKQKFF